MVNRHGHAVGVDLAMKRCTFISVVGNCELHAVHRVMRPVLDHRDDANGDVLRWRDCRKCVANDVTRSNNNIPVIAANSKRSTTVQHHLAITGQYLVVRQDFECVRE